MEIVIFFVAEPKRLGYILTMRATQDINNEINEVRKLRASYAARINEGATDGYNPYDTRITDLSDEYAAAKAAESPLVSDLAGERAWFNAQGFTGANLAEANAACLRRGYSLSDLQAACKSAK